MLLNYAGSYIGCRDTKPRGAYTMHSVIRIHVKIASVAHACVYVTYVRVVTCSMFPGAPTEGRMCR